MENFLLVVQGSNFGQIFFICLEHIYGVKCLKFVNDPTKEYPRGALRAPLPTRTPDRRSWTNPNCALTQTSNKPKVRINLNFEKPKLRTNPNFEQTKKFLALGGLRIIRP